MKERDLSEDLDVDGRILKCIYRQHDERVWNGLICSRMQAFLNKRREENQLDATEWFITLIICSTCFGHFYAHHQELETILVLLPHMVCNALVAGSRLLGT